MKQLLLPADVRAVIHGHAVSDYPDECCGALFGYDREEVREVTHARAILNTHEDNHRRRFRITPKKYMEAENTASSLGRTLLGFYHSHPDHPAVPSGYDLEYAMPFFSYVIVSVAASEIAATTSWLLQEEPRKFIEQPIVEYVIENQ